MYSTLQGPRNLVLASGSTYRRQLLGKLGLSLITRAPNIDEAALPNEDPMHLVMRLSRYKAESLASDFRCHLIIGSDQVAVLDDMRLGKPHSRENAIAQLLLVSGKVVTFLTGVCVHDSQTGVSYSDLDRCRVHFKRLTRAQVERYVALDEPYDCAGSFKSEGLGIALVERIEGDDPNALIGLPLIRLIQLLARFGIAVL